MSKKRKQRGTPAHAAGGAAAIKAQAIDATPDHERNRYATAGRIWLAGALIVALALIAYSNSFRVPFLLDDDFHIVKNSTIRHAWPPWNSMFKHPNITRPVVGFTIAINFAISQLDTFSYHVFNFAVHALASLTLFGIVRRTLLTERLRAQFGPASTSLAFFIAAMWAVHPLATQAVTYITQRGESLMSLFYLLTLYCVIRGAASQQSVPPHRPTRWYLAATLCCALGMGCKQVMFFAPLLVFLYDRTFLSGSWSAPLKRRGALYGALAFTCIIPIALLKMAPADRSAGASSGISPFTYLLTQAGVIPHYLKLAIFPIGQSFDYDWPLAKSAAEVALPGILMLALFGAALWALIKNKAAGFLGVWFFLILAPSSSFMPLIDPAFEYRMYLPVAALSAALVLFVYFVIQKLSVPPVAGAALATVAITGLAVLTYQRNEVYESEVTLWADVVAKQPRYDRAYASLGQALLAHKRAPEAEAALRKAIELNPKSANAYNNLGLAVDEQGNKEEALAWYHKAAEVKPTPGAHNNLALALDKQGRAAEAIEHYKAALKLRPDHQDARYNLGAAYFHAKQFKEAAEEQTKLIRLWPEFVKAHVALGAALLELKQYDAAIAKFKDALRIEPDNPEGLKNLAYAYSETGRPKDAEETYKRLIAFKPESSDAHASYAMLLAKAGRMKEAETEQREAARLSPNDFETKFRQCLLYRKENNLAEARRCYEEAAKLNPDHPGPHFELGRLLFDERRFPEAAEHLKATVRLDGRNLEARRKLVIIYNQQGKLAEVAEQLQEIAKLDSQDVQARTNLGVIYAQMKKLPDAEAEFQQSLQLDPKQTAVRIELSKVLAQVGKPQAALNELKSALKDNPQSFDAHLELGWLHLSDDKRVFNTASAMEAAQKADSISPKDFRAQELLAAVYGKLGQADAGMKALAKAADLADGAGDRRVADSFRKQIDALRQSMQPKR